MKMDAYESLWAGLIPKRTTERDKNKTKADPNACARMGMARVTSVGMRCCVRCYAVPMRPSYPKNGL